MERDVVKVTSYFVNHDELDDEEIANVVANTHYPNRCMNPDVVAIERRTIDYEDDHPINKLADCEQEFWRLFGHSRIELDNDPVSPMIFRLSPIEMGRAKEFMAARKLPAQDQAAAQQQFEFRFIPTTMGTLISICDLVSGSEASLTDLDKF